MAAAKVTVLFDRIAQIRRRTPPRTPTNQQFERRIASLRESLDRVRSGPGAGELRRYLPIALVAALEGYFRSTVRDLVGKGVEPFASRIAAYVGKDTPKLTIAEVRKMQALRLTEGELLAQLIPFGGIEHVTGVMDAAMDGDFKAALEDAFKKFLLMHDTPDQARRLTDDIFARLAEVFRARHVFCHELALKERSPTVAQAEVFLGHAFALAMGTAVVVANLRTGIYPPYSPPVPRTHR